MDVLGFTPDTRVQTRLLMMTTQKMAPFGLTLFFTYTHG